MDRQQKNELWLEVGPLLKRLEAQSVKSPVTIDPSALSEVAAKLRWLLDPDCPEQQGQRKKYIEHIIWRAKQERRVAEGGRPSFGREG